MLALVACGGGDAETPWDSSGGTTGTGDTIDDAGTAGATIFLGNGSGSSFEIGELNIAVTSLSAGGQTSVRATLADVEGNLYQDSATVTFTTDCLASGLATIDSSVNTSDGVVTATYVAQGCSGSDTIRATTTVNGNTTTATGTVSIQPAEIGSMQFVSAEPSVIGLRGVGLTEVSKVSFQVLDTNGNPVSQQVVNFSLNTDIGGVAIPAGSIKATSDIDGIVRTDVKSGTVPTTVRVTAALESNPLISTQSDGLVISTGVSDQNSISLSAE
ncbi:MAG: Ig-like domain-containing protein, partial [Candidatus Thiodiazotropha sp. (ex. Lucinisca nassula)]|nr:Ig-like domain-containing protein [Candidatus Thiodiazotropha sp. (ex. Lucinisca nassula)]